MPSIQREELGPLGPLVSTDSKGRVAYNAEQVVRLKRHVVRMMRGRPEDNRPERFTAAILRHLWDASRVVALAWGYTPSLATQYVALVELAEERRAAGSDNWPPRRYGQPGTAVSRGPSLSVVIPSSVLEAFLVDG